MAISRSFIYTSATPPPRYRTPSPPRGDVEPISPYTVGADWPHNSTTDPTDLRLSFGAWDSVNDGTSTYQEVENAWERPGERKSRAGTAKHSRTGSTIDTLATIALATSPTFASPTLQTGFGDMLSNRKHVPSNIGSIERPSKRARSEKARSPVLQRTDDRPATSHISSSEVMREDVELLLNFASFNNTSRGAASNHYGLKSSPIEGKWNVPTHGLDSPFISENTQPATIRLLSPPTEAPVSDDIGNNKHPSSPTATAFAKLSQSQLHSLDVKTSAELSLQPHFPLADEILATRQFHVDDVVKSDLNRINGDIEEQLFPDSATEAEPEAHDMATATCAACDSAWIDENGADPDGATCWIRCDGCKRWFHLSCTEIKDEEEVKNIDKFNCKDCESTHGPTTYVRKSSRARTAIDYAGLNQGVVKASVDGPEHHYIQPIKDGKLKFLPESFPRMRAELVTAEYFEKSSGMTEPIVIPASLNPRSSIPTKEDTEPELYYPDDDSSTDFSWPDDLDEEEEVIDCGQDGLDMVIPQGLTVRMVADLYGPDEKVEVIDVKSQQGEDKRWNMRKWADYYESEGNAKVIRNVISLEVSQTKLGKLIRRPKIVRDLDLQDSVWPQELKAMGDYPKVQFYCLMSVADCYTDFHIDFGGSSVFYHILKGKKTFFFIPPKEKYLKKYEDWCNSSTQDTVFLGEETKECYRVDLSEGDTMLIPAGWIHAVWTPENSLVIGGNFLTRLHYGMQIKIAKIEKDTKVARKFRYPYFQKILWYAAIKYIEEDPIPATVLEAFHDDENYRFRRSQPVHYEFGKGKSTEEAGSEWYNARYYPQAELDGLPDLAKYLLRTAIIAQELLTEGVTIETRKAVKRSIPKGHGEALDIIKFFGVWLAWKRGNERAANWTHPDMFPSSVKADAKWTRQAEKNASKKAAAAAALEAANASASTSTSTSTSTTNRQSSRKQTVQTPVVITGEEGEYPVPDVSSPSASRASFPSTPKSSGLGPKRVACDACRKRRIRCRHKDESSETKKKSYATRVEMNAKPPRSSSSKPADVDAVGDDDVVVNPMVSRSFTQIDNSLSVNGPALFSKKGRSKACDECRKSKRRCIHDEFGRIDPIKAQEPSKPRAAGTSKRPRASNESLPEPAAKKTKQEHDEDHSGFSVAVEDSSFAEDMSMLVDDTTAYEDDSMPIDPALVALTAPMLQGAAAAAREAEDDVDVGAGGQELNAMSDTSASLRAAQEAILAASAALSAVNEAEMAEEKKQTHTLAVPRQQQDRDRAPQYPLEISFSFPDDHTAPNAPSNILYREKPSTIGPFLASPPNSHEDDVEVSPTATENGAMDLQTPKSNSRHSSRQPKQVDRYVPDPSPATKLSKASPADPDRRLSSSTTASLSIAVDTSTFPDSNQPTLGTGRSSRRESSILSKTQTSPAAAKIASPNAAPGGGLGLKAKSQSGSFGELDADPESLKLIRALQEEDFGLRRRSLRG